MKRLLLLMLLLVGCQKQCPVTSPPTGGMKTDFIDVGECLQVQGEVVTDGKAVYLALLCVTKDGSRLVLREAPVR